jgi:hypothetical protein
MIDDPSGDERGWAADKRDFVADCRDDISDERDAIADARDATADERDRVVDEREAALGTWESDAAQFEVPPDGTPQERDQAAAPRAKARMSRGAQMTMRLNGVPFAVQRPLDLRRKDGVRPECASALATTA